MLKVVVEDTLAQDRTEGGGAADEYISRSSALYEAFLVVVLNDCRNGYPLNYFTTLQK